jgi:UDP-N-acetylmuramoyl-tripeptide--D-alanyl-D-alanine ligase
MIIAADVTVLDESVDNTPQGVLDSLKSLAELTGESRRSVAVLGPVTVESVDPIEIRDEHDRIGRIIVRLNIKKLIVVGNDARHLFKAAELEGSWNGESVLTQTAAEAYDLLRAEIRGGDVVLVKVPEIAAMLTEGAQ